MQLLPTSVSCKLAFLSIWWEHITHYKQCRLYKHLADILKSEVLLSHPQNCNNSSPKRIVKHSCYCQSQTWYSTLLLLKLFTLELHQPLIRYKISAKSIRLMWKTFKAPFLYHPIETWPLHLSWKVANASLLWWTWSFFFCLRTWWTICNNFAVNRTKGLSRLLLMDDPDGSIANSFIDIVY